MKVQNSMKKQGALLLVFTLVALPGCDWFKSKSTGQTNPGNNNGMAMNNNASKADGSAVLVSIGGTPLVTKKMLDAEKEKLMASNPQSQAMIALMDEKQLNRNLVDGMTSREIIRKYVADHKIDSSDKYQQDYATVIGQVRDALNTRYFMDSFAVNVADSEVKKFYEENKDTIPNLLLSRGGIEAVGVPFADEKAAKDFVVKAKAAKNNVEKAAKESGISDKVKDFKLVNEQSLGMEPELRDKITEIKSVPSVNTFKIGKEYWVVAATKKEDPKYRDLDQVKDEIKQLLEKEKTMKKFEEEIARLKGEYKIEVNEQFFADQGGSHAMLQAMGDGDDHAVASADAQDAPKPKANLA